MTPKTITASALIGLLGAASLMTTVSAHSVAEQVSLTEEQAVAIALAEVPGTFEEAELERDDGQLIYEIEILGADGIEMEVEISAETGEILEIEREG
ncbi:PepSY domain-containing protein [Dinoroseobacter sp. S375]|uniref:PepSY domain-containing protein n=1 Tax=Dinoroseobacter sp. S375 TaxID=3415136 RepID=UPI003C7E7CE6